MIKFSVSKALLVRIFCMAKRLQNLKQTWQRNEFFAEIRVYLGKIEMMSVKSIIFSALEYLSGLMLDSGLFQFQFK